MSVLVNFIVSVVIVALLTLALTYAFSLSKWQAFAVGLVLGVSVAASTAAQLYGGTHS